MQILTKKISLLDGKILTVQEADGSFDSKHAVQISKAKNMESQAQEQFEKNQVPYDKTLMYFARLFYPSLYACTMGDVPTLEESYHMDGRDMDAWYQAVLELNHDLFVTVPKPETENPLSVAFRDGTQIMVHATMDLPSYMIRLHRLETEAEDNPPEDPGELYFTMIVYSKLAACSSGDVPSAQETYRFPREELVKWMNAATQLNRHWFEVLLDEGTRALKKQAEEKESVKKKRRNRKANR